MLNSTILLVYFWNNRNYNTENINNKEFIHFQNFAKINNIYRTHWGESNSHLTNFIDSSVSLHKLQVGFFSRSDRLTTHRRVCKLHQII